MILSSKKMIDHYYLQIRTHNSFGVSGNWSEAVSVNVTEPTPGTSSGSTSGPEPWVYGVIVAVIVLLVSPLMVVALIYMYRRFCFHRGLKLVGMCMVPCAVNSCLMCIAPLLHRENHSSSLIKMVHSSTSTRFLALSRYSRTYIFTISSMHITSC